MGVLALGRLISAQRRRQRRRRIQARDDPVPLLAKRGRSSWQQDDHSEGRKRVKYSIPDLPQKIWRHIISLVPMQDAARAACVSRAFLCCWRCYPNIRFSNSTVGCNGVLTKAETARKFTSKVNQALKNHSGIGLKTIKLEFLGHNSSDCSSLDNWLQLAITSEIEELSLLLSSKVATYSFPCSLLSDQSGKSIRYLHLSGCVFRPVVRLGCFRSLMNLCLYHRLTDLQVVGCKALRVVQSKAPNLSSFYFGGKRGQLSHGEQLKNLTMSHPHALDDAHAMLPTTMPNLETLDISLRLKADTPMMHNQFLCIKYLMITVDGYAFPHINDYIYLVPFLDACPHLESFILQAAKPIEHESIFRDPSPLRRMPGHRHDKLKSVTIIGFNSAKSLIELTVHIIENAWSLESLALDTADCSLRCSDDSGTERCSTFCQNTLMEVPRALFAIRRYVEGIVPSAVKLTVLEPCVHCCNHFMT
ncbi:uncharacterized protein LOC123395879 isoform X2 [Hordeum vulgare subsp. vulgare]|uniref:uncharacterized protein LOC123395879 isoform X2 n=1 Tax=Hordeum vulgare subsp. vulgare TaxID=112509 RepID=UPI001D1A4422|nr:uncharacterized protein LOC123395879 isoform X2 [Hordeum vulgare subsp. vulgare]